MKRHELYAIVLIFAVLSIGFTGDASARTIPAAEQAKSNAEPYVHTDVITANWELDLPDNSAPATASTANGNTISAFGMGKPNGNAIPYEHSPAIDPGWILTVPPDHPAVSGANGKTIPAFGMDKPNISATPYEYSPAIGFGWTLTVPPDHVEVEGIGIETSFGLDAGVLEPLEGIRTDAMQYEASFDGSSFSVVPEPSMLILFSLGTFLVRRKH
jgi:hypothetical protein